MGRTGGRIRLLDLVLDDPQVRVDDSEGLERTLGRAVQGHVFIMRGCFKCL